MGQGTARRRRFTASRREVYLDCLRRTGSHRAAAAEAGISASAARRCRQRNGAYEALCAAAEREADARLAGAAGPFDAALDPQFESIRRGPDGRLKIQKTQAGRWTRRIEERFFAVLRESGNFAAAARAVGFTREAIWVRRRRWPAFAARVEETLEEAEITLEFRIACQGTNWSERAEPAGGDEPTQAEPATALNPELALRFLKWREDKRRGRDGRGGAGAARLPGDPAARILRKVMAMKRHAARKPTGPQEEEA